MVANFHYFPFFEYNDLVGATVSGKSVGYHHARDTRETGMESLGYQSFVFGIERGGRFVEKEVLRRLIGSAGYHYPLFLPATHPDALVANFRLQAQRMELGKVFQAGYADGLSEAQGLAFVAETNVLFYGC